MSRYEGCMRNDKKIKNKKAQKKEEKEEIILNIIEILLIITHMCARVW